MQYIFAAMEQIIEKCMVSSDKPLNNIEYISM